VFSVVKIQRELLRRGVLMLNSKIKHTYFKYKDLLITDLTIVPVCVLKWVYTLKIKKQLFPIPLVESSGTRGTLYQHGGQEASNNSLPAVLILHGLYGHPFVMLHLAEIAKNIAGPVFSLYLSYDKENHLPHRALIKQALDQIEKRIKEFKGIVLVGHSIGATEAAYLAFVENDKRIVSTISIAGRLKLDASCPSQCNEAFKPVINQIYQGILSQPQQQLYQIAGRRDWSVSLESAIARRDESCYHIVHEAGHFDLLFHKDLKDKFSEYLEKSLRTYAKN
jgi:predicted alpha/beta hydrolase family esterase